jgi:hypothetical protein
MKTFDKQPSERLDYDFDFTDFLAQRGGDTISQASIVSAPGINVDTSLIVEGRYVKMFVSGGTAGQTYKATCLAETVGGRIAELEMQIRVKEL